MIPNLKQKIGTEINSFLFFPDISQNKIYDPCAHIKKMTTTNKKKKDI